MRKRVRRDTDEGWWLKEKGPEEKEKKMKRSRIVDSGLRIEDFYRQAARSKASGPLSGLEDEGWGKDCLSRFDCWQNYFVPASVVRCVAVYPCGKSSPLGNVESNLVMALLEHFHQFALS
jgi:hypothetical protein